MMKRLFLAAALVLPSCKGSLRLEGTETTLAEPRPLAVKLGAVDIKGGDSTQVSLKSLFDEGKEIVMGAAEGTWRRDAPLKLSMEMAGGEVDGVDTVEAKVRMAGLELRDFVAAKVEVEMGSVEAELSERSESFTADLRKGSLRVRIPSGVPVSLSLDTSEVNLELKGGLVLSPRGVRLTIRAREASVELGP